MDESAPGESPDDSSTREETATDESPAETTVPTDNAPAETVDPATSTPETATTPDASAGEPPGEEPSGPAVPPDGDTPLRAFLVAAGLGVLGPVLLILVGIPLLVANFAIGLSTAVFLVVATTIGQYVGFGGLALGYLQGRGFDWDGVRSYLGVRVPTLKDLAVVVGGWVAIFGLIIVLSLVASLFLPEPAENQGAVTAMENPEIIPLMMVMMFLVVGPCEELLYRGVVQNRLRETFSALPAIALASAVFASIHVVALGGGGLTGRLVTITILFFPSLVFGAVYEYTGNLVVPALLHSIHNSVLLGLLYLSILFEEELEQSATALVETATLMI